MSENYQAFKGDKAYIHTFTGGRFFFDDMEGSDIRIVDIAHALSNNCRFSGHTTQFYSVAQHCVGLSWRMQSELKSERMQFIALLHDASEAYLHDIPSPTKAWFRENKVTAFDELEKRIEEEIFRRWSLANITIGEHQIIKEADRRMAATEVRDLMPPGDYANFGGVPIEPYNEFHIVGWPPAQAERAFLAVYHRLSGDKE